jgi:hypothetical protein
MMQICVAIELRPGKRPLDDSRLELKNKDERPLDDSRLELKNKDERPLDDSRLELKNKDGAWSNLIKVMSRG